MYPTGSMGAVSYNGQHNISFSEGSVFRKIDGRKEVVFMKPTRPRPLHPWFTAANWFDEIGGGGGGGGSGGGGASAGPREGSAVATNRSEGYYAMVQPGFVNGLDPLVYGAPEIKLDKAPTTDQRQSPYLIGNQVKPSEDIKRVPGLLEAPLVPLFFSAYRSATSQASNFFQKKYDFDPAIMQGAEASGSATGSGRNPSNRPANSSNGQTQSQEQSPWVGFCDLYLATARVNYDMAVTPTGFPVTGIDYSFSYRTGALEDYGQRARLLVGVMPQGKDIREQGVAALLGTPVDDDGLDFIKISTVYVLKSGDWGGDADKVTVNGIGEQVFVQHHCFWNLEHRSRNQNIADLPDINASEVLLPLVGQYSIAPIATVAIMEGMLGQAVASIINDNGSIGKYWT